METTNNTGDKKLPQGAWKVVTLLFFVGALNYLDRSMITTMRESIVTAIPMSDAQFGLLTSVFLWVYGGLSPFAGFLADKFNRSKVIIASLFIWSAVTLLTGYATTFGELLATRALMGISEACYIPAALALIMDYHRGGTRSTAAGINMAGIMVGSSLGFAGGWIAELHSWSTAFEIFGLIGIGYAILLVFVLREAPASLAGERGAAQLPVNFLAGIRDLLSRKAFLLLLAFYGSLGMVGWIVLGWLPTFYQERFHISQHLAGVYATGYLYPAGLVGLITGGFLADRWSRKNPRGRILVPALGLLVAAPAIYLASTSLTLTVVLGCFVLYALTQRFTDANLMPILCLIADNRYRATGYGMLNFLSTIIGGLGIYAGGMLRDARVSLGMAFQAGALVMVCCAGLLLLIRLHPSSDR